MSPTSGGSATLSGHPSGDKRFRILDAAMKRHHFHQGALIEVLHQAQDLFGFLETDVLFYIARGLRLQPSRVYGVATFYHLFTLTPQGRHTCVVCMGTACFVKGADRLLAALERTAGVRSGETTKDGALSLLTARCLGACGLAPAVVYDRQTSGQQSPDDAVARVGAWLGDGAR